MRNVQLLRIFKRTDGVFGVLSIDNFPLCLTCERPWLNNQKGISCIPTGHFGPKRVNSPKFGNTFEVPVEGRSEILFHSGNIDDDSHGCIILGEEFNKWTTGQLSVSSSKIAFALFMQELVGENEFQLEVKEIA